VRGRLVDLADRGAQIVARLHEVVALSGQEGQPLALLGVLLHGEHVDRSDALERLDDLGELLAQALRLALDVRRLLEEGFERPPPLALEALADPFETSLQLLPLQLELVPAIGGRALRGARLADLSLRGLERLRDVLQCLLPRARLLLGRGPLPEQPLAGFRPPGAGAAERPPFPLR